MEGNVRKAPAIPARLSEAFDLRREARGLVRRGLASEIAEAARKLDDIRWEFDKIARDVHKLGKPETAATIQRVAHETRAEVNHAEAKAIEQSLQEELMFGFSSQSDALTALRTGRCA